jgi:hypothetical protein
MWVGKVSDRGDGFEVAVQSIHLKITLDQVHFAIDLILLFLHPKLSVIERSRFNATGVSD